MSNHFESDHPQPQLAVIPDCAFGRDIVYSVVQDMVEEEGIDLADITITLNISGKELVLIGSAISEWCQSEPTEADHPVDDSDPEDEPYDENKSYPVNMRIDIRTPNSE